MIHEAPKTLLWLDLETTGLHPTEDVILEFAAFVATFAHPFDVNDEPDFYVVFSHRDWEVPDPLVFDMHRRSGLVDACFDSSALVADAEKALLERFKPYGKDLVLAGSSVHFDLGFLREHMPDFAALLSHRVYDVSAVKLFCRSLGMPTWERPEPAHRAVPDVRASIADARRCADWIARNGYVAATEVVSEKAQSLAGALIAKVLREP